MKKAKLSVIQTVGSRVLRIRNSGRVPVYVVGSESPEAVLLRPGKSVSMRGPFTGWVRRRMRRIRR